MQKHSTRQKLKKQESFFKKTLKDKRNFLSFFNYKLKNRKGYLHEYDFLDHFGTSVMIPIDLEENIHFIKQWGRSSRKVLLELLAGRLDAFESKEMCEQKELQEEIGYFANKLTYLDGFFRAPGYCIEYLYLLLEEELVKKPIKGKNTQFIEKIRLSLAETLKVLDNGAIEDAKTLCGILKYLRHIEKLSY
jgi:ADP-ribose pyrophosphatase